MKTLQELSDSFYSFIHTREGAIIFTSSFALVILLIGKLKDKISQFIKWREWRKINKRVRMQDKRKGHIVYKNTREEFLKRKTKG